MKKTKKIIYGGLLGAAIFALGEGPQLASAANDSFENRRPMPGQGSQRGNSDDFGKGNMGPQEGMGMNSAEAKEACEDLSEGDSCSFSITLPNDDEEKEIEGTCQTTPKDEELACRPEAGEKNQNMSRVENQIRLTKEMNSREENNFSRMENRLEKLIDFLDSKDIDTDELESDLETFQTKSSAVLEAMQNYLSILEDLQSDGSEDLSDEAKEARTEIKNLMDDLRDFYQNTLKSDIKEKMDELES